MGVFVMPKLKHMACAASAALILWSFTAGSAALAQDAADFGKPGEKVTLTVGYQPYYTEAWSALVMKAKGFWKKYLPAGSEVDFEPGLQGSVLVGQMIAGKQQIAYMGDMPAIIASARPQVADIRIIAALGTSQQQCNVFLVRKDAPDFKSAEEAIKWLNGKVVASPQGSCTDRFARKVFQKLSVKPDKYFNQGGDQIAANFKAGKLDAAVVWEPIAAKLIDDGLARRAASGVNFNETDAGFLVMRHDLAAARPDVEKAWLEAELDAQMFLADPKNATEITAIAAAEATGYPRKVLWNALYGDYPAALGGSADRLTFDYVLTDKVKAQLAEATAFLFDLKRVPAQTLRQDALADDVARSVLAARGLKSPIGAIRSQTRAASAQ
jgi:NitT/TauT family transport system substrate-binding protein